MSSKEMKTLVNLSHDELVSKVREAEAALFDNRMKHSTGQLANPSLLWKERKQVARFKTILKQTALRKAASK